MKCINRLSSDINKTSLLDILFILRSKRNVAWEPENSDDKNKKPQVGGDHYQTQHYRDVNKKPMNACKGATKEFSKN